MKNNRIISALAVAVILGLFSSGEAQAKNATTNGLLLLNDHPIPKMERMIPKLKSTFKKIFLRISILAYLDQKLLAKLEFHLLNCINYRNRVIALIA